MYLNIINLEKMEYSKTLDIQKKIQQKRISGEIYDTLLIVEHEPVLTMGKRGMKENVLVSQKILDDEDIKTVWINRGGDVTYHGFGQMVGYPIINLLDSKLGIRVFVDKIQQVFIDFLKSDYDIDACKKSGVHTGVWVNDKKITAIGISVRKAVTMHGFAFNINTNLKHFDYINPCGLGVGMVTSLQQVLGEKIDYEKTCSQIIDNFCLTFEKQARYIDLSDILQE